jgi:hypothetical protein
VSEGSNAADWLASIVMIQPIVRSVMCRCVWGGARAPTLPLSTKRNLATYDNHTLCE